MYYLLSDSRNKFSIDFILSRHFLLYRLLISSISIKFKLFACLLTYYTNKVSLFSILSLSQTCQCCHQMSVLSLDVSVYLCKTTVQYNIVYMSFTRSILVTRITQCISIRQVEINSTEFSFLHSLVFLKSMLLVYIGIIYYFCPPRQHDGQSV